MKNKSISISLEELEQLACRETGQAVSVLMKHLSMSQTGLMCQKIDYCLGLVESSEGIEAITHYLFNGTKIQRNYAALYFKRKNNHSILCRAVSAGCIDKVQAFSR